jgi:hypothetical protein
MIIRSFIVCLASIYATSVFADAPADFSGQWIADEHTADNGDTPVKSDAPPGGHSGGGHGGGMGGGGHGMGGGHHGGRNMQNANGGTSTIAMPGNDPRVHAHTLIIRQSDSVFDVAADGQRTAYRFGNRNNYGAQYGGTVTLKWLSPEMSVETHPDTGGTVIEHYTMSDDGKHMALEIRTEQADGSAREVRREFHRDDGSATSATTLP